MLSSGGQTLAKDMSFRLQEKDLRPNLDLYQWIFADGEIVSGTTTLFLSFVKNNPQLIPGATVILNSPGGSPVEGMRFGDVIRELHYRTEVGVAGYEPLNRLPGQCMSACIYPYLGGEYRYLGPGSAIGIHRFTFGKDFGGPATSEISQKLSGQIVDYIKRSRADPSLFALMTQTPPDEVYVLSSDELQRFKIVTGDIYSENWSFEVHGNVSYLKADQVTWRGENKLLFGCVKGNKSPLPFVQILSRRATGPRIRNPRDERGYFSSSMMRLHQSHQTPRICGQDARRGSLYLLGQCPHADIS